MRAAQFALVLAAVTLTGCSSGPWPSTSPAPTADTPRPTLPPLGTSLDAGWSMVASERVDLATVDHRVAAASPYKVLFACEGEGSITIQVVDAEVAVNPVLMDFTTGCSTTVQEASGVGPAHDTSLNVGITGTRVPGMRYWVLVAVPDTQTRP